MPNWKKIIVSGSDASLSSLYIDGNLTASAAFLTSASIGHLETIYETASVIYTSGSTKFGDTSDDTHERTGSLLVSGNITLSEGTQLTGTSSFAITASHAGFADQAQQASDLFITVRNTSGADIGKGLAVHATGVTGENVNIKLADSDIPGDMPAIGLTETAISNNGSGRVIINGRLKSVDTSLLIAGSPVYVNGAGTLTATKPTGSGLIQNIGTAAKINASDGEIILQGSGRSNDVPNITENYLWLGNSSGVATPVVSSSLKVDNATTSSHTTGTASIANNAVTSSHTAGTASIANNATSASYSLTGDGVFSGSFSGSFQGDGSGLTGVSVTAAPGYSNDITLTSDYTTNVNTYNSLYGPLTIGAGITVTVSAGSFLKIEDF